MITLFAAQNAQAFICLALGSFNKHQRTTMPYYAYPMPPPAYRLPPIVPPRQSVRHPTDIPTPAFQPHWRPNHYR